MIDLAALKAYEHHLNATASDEQIAAFRRQSFIEQCTEAADWKSGHDTRLDIVEKDTFA